MSSHKSLNNSLRAIRTADTELLAFRNGLNKFALKVKKSVILSNFKPIFEGGKQTLRQQFSLPKLESVGVDGSSHGFDVETSFPISEERLNLMQNFNFHVALRSFFKDVDKLWRYFSRKNISVVLLNCTDILRGKFQALLYL
jgi:hypothetical protein